jgi:DNA-binding transcriptional regulator GbsR (MarR family)
MTELQLKRAKNLAADAIGDVIAHWGFRAALGRVWTVLYLDLEPRSASEIAKALRVSAGTVSTTMAELLRWGVVRRVWRPGERKEFYEAETDFWKMISRVVNERERFLAESVRTRLQDAAALAKTAHADAEQAHVLSRLQQLVSFAVVAQTVIDSFVRSQTADFQKFGSLLDLATSRRA